MSVADATGILCMPDHWHPERADEAAQSLIARGYLRIEDISGRTVITATGRVVAEDDDLLLWWALHETGILNRDGIRRRAQG